MAILRYIDDLPVALLPAINSDECESPNSIVSFMKQHTLFIVIEEI